MNVLIIGPHPPLKGGISDFNHQLYLHLEEFKNFDKSKWVKMMCCIPNEYKKNYETYVFKVNFLTGINKKKIMIFRQKNHGYFFGNSF
mgnify:CR=1 FL=1